MESSKVLCLIAFVVVFLVTSSAGGRGEGLMSFNDLANQGDIDNKFKACCDLSQCLHLNDCWCSDIGTRCHAACKDCFCKSDPPYCRCMDNTPYSYGPCTYEAANNI